MNDYCRFVTLDRVTCFDCGCEMFSHHTLDRWVCPRCTALTAGDFVRAIRKTLQGPRLP